MSKTLRFFRLSSFNNNNYRYMSTASLICSGKELAGAGLKLAVGATGLKSSVQVLSVDEPNVNKQTERYTTFLNRKM